jgi:two-component system response regulator YesN
MDQRVEMVIDFMIANLKQPPPLLTIARKVNLSPSHLSHLFGQETGQSPGNYLMMLRMRRAAELLRGSALVKEIMDAVGFKDKSNFLRSFRKAYALSPSEYRAKRFDPTQAHRIARLTTKKSNQPPVSD